MGLTGFIQTKNWISQNVPAAKQEAFTKLLNAWYKQPENAQWDGTFLPNVLNGLLAHIEKPVELPPQTVQNANPVQTVSRSAGPETNHLPKDGKASF